VIRELGGGAMGEVYLADDEVLSRKVAIKTIRTRGLSELAAATFRGRFANEAKAAASLSHPNIVGVYDLGAESDTQYIVMEVVDGPSLKTRLQDGPLSAADTRVLGIQVARALDAAHARGIVHRDVKPANILAAAPSSWKLADFGIARIPASSITITGQFLGSPAYASPEAFDRGELTPSGDVYSLGATLYECLTGRLPHGEGDMASLAASIAKREPEPIAALAHDVPPELAAAVMRALARDPAERPTAAALADALAGGSNSAPAVVPRSRRRPWVWLVGFVTLLVIGAIALGPSRQDGASASAIETPASAPSPVAAPDDPRWDDVRRELAHEDYGQARDDLEQIMRDHPDDPDARALLQQLDDRERGPGPGPPGKHHGKGHRRDDEDQPPAGR